MAIRGSLSEASLADVLQLLALGRKSGSLSVADGSSFGRIYFDRGIVTHASIVNRKDRLGDLLVKNRVVHPAELEEAIAAQHGQHGPRLGEILVERGAVTRDQIEKFVRIQIEEAVYLLFAWTRGSFHFEPGEVPEGGEVLVEINPESLLLEGARRVDEWAVIEKKIPSFDLVFSLDLSHGDPEAADLAPDQHRILELVDGRRSVREIVEDSGLLEFEAAKAFFGLIQAGFARHSGRKRATTEALAATGAAEHRNLGAAFYRTGMLDDAERAFRRTLELQPDDLDSHFYLASVRLRKGDTAGSVRLLRALIERAGPTPATFQNLALALESAGRLEQALLTVDAALRDRPGHPALLLSRGILLTKTGELTAACQAFDRFERVSDPAGSRPSAYFIFSTVALAGAGRLDEAAARAERGLDLHPRSAPLLTHAAAVRERQGAFAEAEDLCRRALAEDADLPQARRALADLLFRRGAFPEAEPLYSRFVDEGLVGAEVHFRLGTIAYRRGDRPAALDHWRTALEIDPTHESAKTNLELVEAAVARSGS